MLGRRHHDARHAKGSPLRGAFFVFLSFIALAFAPVFVLSVGAQGVGSEVQQGALQVATTVGLTTVSLASFVGTVIKVFLGLLGVIALLIVIYGGFLWMTSGGDDAKVLKAKKTLTNGAIGLVIVLSAFAIVSYLFGGPGGGLIGGPTGGNALSPPCFGVTCAADHHSDALGNGIIQYHYPEPNQNDVPRNTKVAITFKKPLLLSSVIRNYDDKGTYDLTDDRLCTPDCLTQNHQEAAITDDTVFELNTSNVKIIPMSDLATPAGGAIADQFDARYAQALANGGAQSAVTARLTAVPAAYVPGQQQTIVIKPTNPIGSPTADVNYRVALRGGDTGIRIWDDANGTPKAANALDLGDADGAYYWLFTTNTTIDVTPPQVTAAIPRPQTDPQAENAVLDRNQLLQVYFNEAVDPTTASGILGEGGGLTTIEIQAKCLPNRACDAPWNTASFATVPGTVAIGNRYRTIEFTPSARCENVAENSCGAPVYCLPKNVELQVGLRAASVGPTGTQAVSNDGIVDMVDNSLDGNKNTKTEGPATAEAEFYVLNSPPASVDGLRDSVRARYTTGNTVDLEPPAIVDTDPKSSVPGGVPTAEAPFPAGPSKFPVDRNVSSTWSKTLSVNSLVTGGLDNDDATVVLQSLECKKQPGGPGSGSCPRDTEELAKPWFFIDLGDPVQVAGRDATRLSYVHRVFMTATDLGYTEADQPRYAPLLRAKIQDTKQNCFYPSVGGAGYECQGTDATNTSCCNRLGQASAVCTPQ